MSTEVAFKGDFLAGKALESKMLDLPKTKSNRKKRNQIKRRYWALMIGVLLLYAGYNSYLLLQTSIHVEGGLGKFR